MGIIFFIGFTVLWVVIFLIFGSIFNTRRVRSGVDIDDFLTGFITGLALGPFAIMSGLDPRNTSKKGRGMLPGGVVGVVLFLSTYFSL